MEEVDIKPDNESVTLTYSKAFTYAGILVIFGASVYTFLSAMPELKELHDDNIKMEENLSNCNKSIEEIKDIIKEMDSDLSKVIIDINIILKTSENERIIKQGSVKVK